jgi:hypothetical protein
MRGQFHLDPRRHHDGLHATLHVIADDLVFDLHLVVPIEQARDLVAALTALLPEATPS